MTAPQDDITPEGIQIMRDKAAPHLAGKEFVSVVDEAAGRLRSGIAEAEFHELSGTDLVSMTKADAETLLASHATLTAENEALRGKVGELAKLAREEYLRAEARRDERDTAEAQLATARAEAWEEGREAGWAHKFDIDNPYRKNGETK